MSRRRAVRPLMRYSLSPERYSRRVMVISPGLCAAGAAAAGFSATPLACPLAWPLAPLFRSSDLHDVGLAGFRVHQGQGDVGHPDRLAVPRAGEDHVLHAGAAEALGGLLAQHPADGIAEVRLPAAVRAHDGGNAAAVELEFGAVAERFESLQFDAFQFQQTRYLVCSGESSCNYTNRAKTKSKDLSYGMMGCILRQPQHIVCRP